MAARAVALLTIALCAAVVLKLTLAPSRASVGIAHTNLKPGATIRLYLNQATLREAVLELGGNIALGVPLGLLLPVISPRFRGLLRVMLVAALAFTLLETAQRLFVEGRSFDVDDIILAVAGAAIGYLPIGRYLGLRLHPEHRHWWQRRLSGVPYRSRSLGHVREA